MHKCRSIWCFFINVCGSAHVFVVEKKSNGNTTWWRIFQSWQDHFTLTQWIGVHPWENTRFHQNFLDHGNGKKIACEQLVKILDDLIRLSRPRMQQFRDFGGAIPYELDITSFSVM